MKKRLYISFLIVFVCGLLSAQSVSINKFWGIEFGLDRPTTLNRLMDKVPKWQIDLNVENIKEKDQDIYFKEVRFGGLIFNLATLSFHEDSLYSAIFVKNHDDVSDSVDFFASLLELLEFKYGEAIDLSEDGEVRRAWLDDEKNRKIFLFVSIEAKDDISVALIYSDGNIKKLKDAQSF